MLQSCVAAPRHAAALGLAALLLVACVPGSSGTMRPAMTWLMDFLGR